MGIDQVNDLIRLKLVHEIHTSERKSFRACRRRWDWIFRDNLYPYMTAKPLEFGTAFHYGMEKYYDPETWNWPRDVVGEYAIQQFVKKCNEQRQAFLKQEAVPYLEEDVQADYNERVELGVGMLRYYFTHIAPQQDRGWTPVKVEVAFMVSIEHPDTKEPMVCKCDQCKDKWRKYLTKKAENEAESKSREISRQSSLQDYSKDGTYRSSMQPIRWEINWDEWQGLPVVYAGRVDMLAEDTEGQYWVFDWKSARSVNVDHDEFLEIDDQVASYVWALRKIGLPVRGFIYHEQRKAFPRPPEQNKTMRLGRMFSVSKQQETDYDTYVRTIAKEDTDAYEMGLYNDFLEFLKNEGIVFYKRWQIHKSDYQNAQTELNIGLEALEIIDPNLRIYPSPGRFGCTTCAFRQPCLEQNAGGDYKYALDTLFERREHYYVREEASTESKGGE